MKIVEKKKKKMNKAEKVKEKISNGIKERKQSKKIKREIVVNCNTFEEVCEIAENLVNVPIEPCNDIGGGGWPDKDTRGPAVVFLMKTKNKYGKLERLWNSMRYDWYYYLHRMGLACGLALWWNIDICQVNEYLIDFVFTW